MCVVIFVRQKPILFRFRRLTTLPPNSGGQIRAAQQPRRGPSGLNLLRALTKFT